MLTGSRALLPTHLSFRADDITFRPLNPQSALASVLSKVCSLSDCCQSDKIPSEGLVKQLSPVKRLPHKHKDPSSTPRTHVEKLGVVLWACNPSTV